MPAFQGAVKWPQPLDPADFYSQGDAAQMLEATGTHLGMETTGNR